MQSTDMNKLAICLIAVGLMGGLSAFGGHSHAAEKVSAASGDMCAIAASFNGTAADRALANTLRSAVNCPGQTHQ